MSAGFLIQSAASLVAVILLVGLAGWARIGRPCPALDQGRARALLADEFPDDRLDAVWISADGRAAIARSAGKALILFQIGDGYVARAEPWEKLVAAQPAGGEVRLKFGEIGAPEAKLKLSPGFAWPPVMEGLA